MTTTNDLIEKFEKLQKDKGYLQRVDKSHPLDIFIGIDENGNDELALFTELEPARLSSSRELEVEKNIRQDGRWATQIASTNKKNRDIFAQLCVDLIVSSKDAVSEQSGMERLIKRFAAWQRLFASMKTTLPVSVLKGLIGELTFAKEYMSQAFGWDDAISAWVGPDGADRDFTYGDKWYEIKAISTGKNNVTISSLNQLEVDTDGFLCIFSIDESSQTDTKAFNVSDFINDCRKKLADYPKALHIFEQKLISIGYIDKTEYKELFFSVNDHSFYIVDEQFPKLVTKNVPQQIVGAKYDIDIASISKWKVDDGRLWK